MQFLILSALLRDAGTGIMVVLFFAVGIIVVGITGNATAGALLSAAVSIFFLLLIITATLHVVRFVMVAVLSVAVIVKRLLRKL